MDILKDIKTAIQMAAVIHRARKGGEVVRMQIGTYTPPPPSPPGLYYTVEGCEVWKCGPDVREAVGNVFGAFPYDVKRRLSFSPTDGEFCERARLWQTALKAALPPAQYSAAITTILHGYCRIKRMRLEGVT